VSQQATSRRCSACGGDGRKGGIGFETVCRTCGGDGTVNRTVTSSTRCGACNGTKLQSTKEQLEAMSMGLCYQCNGTGALACVQCKGAERVFAVSPELRTPLEEHLKALAAQDPFALLGPKLPPVGGKPELDEDEDYTKMFFKGGQWVSKNP